MPNQPNVLFISTDQQRWDTLGRFKPKNLQTPNMDRLLARSVHLPNTFCQAPICIPSRCCMLAGQYPWQTGVYQNSGVLSEDKITWAGELSKNGYLTASVGRAHEIYQGFHWRIPLIHGDSFNDMNDRLNGPKQEWSYSHYDYRFDDWIYEGDFEEYAEVRSVNTACQLMKDFKDSHRPWAMYVGMLAPHNPYLLPRKYADFYSAADFDMPKIFEEDFTKPSYTANKLKYWEPFTEEYIRETRRVYYSMVTMIDELLGRILDQLDSLGETENTIIIFTADHGEMNGDHALWAKINFYDESIKIPCLISYPAAFEGGIENLSLAESIDFMPTLLDFAGLEVPDSVSGLSLAPLLNGKTPKHKSMIASGFEARGKFMRCIRTEDYCYSFGYPTQDGLTGELYDLKTDPDERFNVHDDIDYQDVRMELIQRIWELEISRPYRLCDERPDLKWNFPQSMHMH